MFRGTTSKVICCPNIAAILFSKSNLILASPIDFLQSSNGISLETASIHQGFFRALSHNTVFVFQIQFVKGVKGVKKSAEDLGAPRSLVFLSFKNLIL